MKRHEQLTEQQERELLAGHGQIRSSLPETFPREALGEKREEFSARGQTEAIPSTGSTASTD